MKISDYLPSLYNYNVEMLSLIGSEETELETKLKKYIEDAFKDNFPKIATENGIEKYEKILSIQLDENQDNLEYRRARVLAKLTTTVPLSYRWLENNLINLVGEGNYKIELENNIYKLTISIANVYKDTAELLYGVYRPLIPANLTLIVNIFEEEEAHLYFGAIMREGENILLQSEVE